jgi:acetylornithine deacetylase/succinyl-diaminopimelate desuccinylase family protein
MMSPSPDAGRMKRDLAALIGFDTQNPPGHEAELAVFLRDLISAEGFELTLQAFKPGRVNVIAKLENGAGPVFALNTHMDVVPAGDGWSSDPFTLREANGRLYGRGACDCKGPLAAMVETLRMLARNRNAWSGTLLGVFVADEEIASEGAKSYASTKPHIDYAIVGEPTSNTTVTAHKGSLRPLVRVQGVSAHSGTPHLGENAIYRAGELVGVVSEYHDTVIRRRSHPLVGGASLTVTRVSGGHADNVLPGSCDLLLDRRMIPGEDESATKEEIEALLEFAHQRFGVRANVIEYRATTGGATETAVEEPIVRASLAASRAYGTGDPGPFGFQGACDLVHFASIGAKGVVVGPGALAVAHKPDEFVPVDELVAASLIYRDVVLAMLRPDG